MPIKKLVELDSGGFSTEIDSVKLKRVANAFKKWLLEFDLNTDPFGFLQKDLPLVELALNGGMELPFKGSEPHTWEWHEGLLPQEYKKACAPFYNTIRGMDLVVERDGKGNIKGLKIIEKDGKRYAWAEFEDPPDASLST